MTNTYLSRFAVAFSLFWPTCAIVPHEKPPVHVTTTSAVVQAPAAPLAPVVTSNPIDTRDSVQFKRLHDHVLGVMRGWPKGSKELEAVNLNDLATDIAAAVLIEPMTINIATGRACDTVHGSDRCFWPDGWSSDGNKAVLLASIAYYEGSRFSSYVDRGLCNNKAWRKDPANARAMKLGGDCDGGHAHSLWQIHAIKTVHGADDHLESVCGLEHIDGFAAGTNELDDDRTGWRFGAARCALELARRSIAARGNLSWYSGESAYSHPKADDRLNFAQKAVREHPFVVVQ